MPPVVRPIWRPSPLVCAQAARRAVRFQKSRIDHDRLRIGVLGGQADHDPAKTPSSLQRFQRLDRVSADPCSLGASHHRKPLRLMKTMPLGKRRSSTRGRPWLLVEKRRRRAICAIVSQNRLLIHQALLQKQVPPGPSLLVSQRSAHQRRISRPRHSLSQGLSESTMASWRAFLIRLCRSSGTKQDHSMEQRNNTCSMFWQAKQQHVDPQA